MPKGWGKFDFSEVKMLAKNLKNADAIIDHFIQDSVMRIAFRADKKIKQRTPPGSGNLRRMWQVGSVSRSGDAYTVEIINNAEYASYVENGFRAHWVPGKWEGNTFVYIKNYTPPPGQPGGMQVGPKNGWVDGKFMMRISIKEIEEELPAYMQRRQDKLLRLLIRGKKPKAEVGGEQGASGEEGGGE